MKKDKTYEELAEEYAEIGLDRVVSSIKKYIPIAEIIGEDTPLVKTTIAAIKLPKNISDTLLAVRLNEFLYGADLDKKKVEKLKKKLGDTQNHQLYEQILFSVNSHNDKRKSRYLGLILKAFTNDGITKNQLFDMYHAVENLNLNNLDKLREYYRLDFEIELPKNVINEFANLGLVDIDSTIVGRLSYSGGQLYPRNQLGWKFVGIVCNSPPSGFENVNIGEGILISEVDENGLVTSRAYPIEYFYAENAMFREVCLVVLNEKQEILCEPENLNPLLINQIPVPAGIEASYFPAHSHERVEKFEAGPTSIVSRVAKSLGKHITIQAVAVSGAKAYSEGRFMPLKDVAIYFESKKEFTDLETALSIAVQKCKELISGELGFPDWMEFYRTY